jgi:hypothetical protein
VSLAVAPPLESIPAIPADANPSANTITTLAPEATTTTITVPSTRLTKLSQWWESHREGILTSVVEVFGVTSKVLEMVPLAETAAKVFENAAKVLEEVQVPFFLDGPSPTILTDELANSAAVVGEYRRRPRLDSANGAHPHRSQTMRAAATASHAKANRQVAGVSV